MSDSENQAFIRALMIATAAAAAIVIAFMLVVALMPRYLQTRVRAPILRGTEQLFKILDGTANAYAIVVVISLIGMVIASVLLLAATVGR
jgi:hypothetical protein